MYPNEDNYVKIISFPSSFYCEKERERETERDRE